MSPSATASVKVKLKWHQTMAMGLCFAACATCRLGGGSRLMASLVSLVGVVRQNSTKVGTKFGCIAGTRGLQMSANTDQRPVAIINYVDVLVKHVAYQSRSSKFCGFNKQRILFAMLFPPNLAHLSILV